jgi:small-conductance mechanosensitive channel
MHSLWWTISAALAAMALALVVVAILHAGILRWSRRSLIAAELASHSHRPFQVFGVLLAGRLVFQLSPVNFGGHDGLLHVWGILEIIAAAWLVGSVLLAVEDAAEDRYSFDIPDNRYARRIRTQIAVVRRITIASIVVITFGALLTTFPEVRAIGASVLASAGVIGIVAALAAQSLLGNVIAGLQLAFSDAVRLDDVVVVEGEWAKVEEITLSHVVLRIWDDRRLIMPTSYFTTKPYQNWTRTKAEVLGTVEFDVDWLVDVPGVRSELSAIVSLDKHWDGRVCQLDVTNAIDGVVRLRALLSAGDAGDLWDLRCAVREHLVAWMRDNQPAAIPRGRLDLRHEDRREPGEISLHADER